MSRPDVGRVGAWFTVPPEPDLARAVDEQGYGAIWVGSSQGGDLGGMESILTATQNLVAATGVVNAWRDEPAAIAAAHHRLVDTYPGRFLLGVGVGHPELDQAYSSPYQSLVAYLDALDEAGVEPEQRAVAALGPKMVRLAGERSAGAHPFAQTVEHTRRAREILGAGPLLAPEQKVLLDPDVDHARELARGSIGGLLNLTNYVTAWRRLGYTDEDFSNGLSDRLVDDVVACGSVSDVARRVEEQFAAGADHVCLHLMGPNNGAEAFAQLAEQLPL